MRDLSAEPDPVILGQVVRKVLQNTSQFLQRDPYYLVHRNLARDKLIASDFESMMNDLRIKGDLSLIDVIELDHQMNQAEPYKSIFQQHFLENLLTLHLERAAGTAKQMSGFFTGNQGINDLIVQRAIRGIYPESAISQVLAKKMTFKSMKDSGLTFPFRNERESYLAAQALDRLGQVDLVFKNLAFDKNQDQSLDEAYYSSSDRRALRFSDDGLQLPRQKILPYGSLFKNGEKQRNEPNANWAMWSRVLASGPITGLNASKGLEAELSDWLGDVVFPWVEEIPQESELSFVSSRNLYDEFYEAQAYSLAEKRALAFYIIKNLIGIVVPDPEMVNVADPEISRAAGLFTGFIGQEFFLKRNQSWSGSQAILPLEIFAGGNFSEMGMNLLPSRFTRF